jgi:hypothetical protein
LSKGHQGQEACPLEGYYSLSLVLSAIAGTFATEEFAARGNQLCQDGKILVVDPLDLVTTKAAAIIVFEGGSAFALAESFSSLKSHCKTSSSALGDQNTIEARSQCQSNGPLGQ